MGVVQARLPKLPILVLWGSVALVAASLSANLFVIFLAIQGFIRPSPSLMRILMAMRTDIPQPGKYDLFGHIYKYQRNPSTWVNGKPRQDFLMPPQFRDDLGKLLEALGGFKSGVELGVQQGKFSETLLSTWPSCERYYLVDIWAAQSNYVDGANVDDYTHEMYMQEAKTRLSPWSHKTHFIRDHTLDAVTMVPDNLDFVYVDARHDYCGAKQDIEAWWPKIRPGGIMAGHDYRDAAAVWPRRDWALCANGDRHPGSVAAAVNEFAMRHGLQVLATWGRSEWSSWIIRKPSH